MNLIFKCLVTALVFLFVLPLVHGVGFHGGFVAAIALALLFGILLWIVDAIALALSVMLTITSLGLALLWLIPLWIFGFWLLPAVALKILADLFPTYLTIAGWVPAILSGLIMMFVGVVTSALTVLAVRGSYKPAE
jgi:uncharacterized membrane protein YvlD (DUF360 family)